jgi:HSP20 family protein
MAEAQTKPAETSSRAEETHVPMSKGEGVTPFESLRREVDRLFEEFRPTAWRWPFRRPDIELSWPREGWGMSPAMDLVEKDASYEISAELPGMDESNIDIKLGQGMLTIRGEKREQKEEKKKEYHLSERRFGSFRRSFALPADVDADKIDAKCTKGVLTVTLPKSEEAKRDEKTIEVKTG